MIRNTFFCLTLIFAFTVNGQENAEQEQINKDVWYNFMQAYQDLDASLFNQIHTDDVLRTVNDGGRMYIGREYKDKNLEVFNNWNAQRINQKIEFSFISRVQKGEFAYEIGIYKLTRKRGTNSSSAYGKFHVILKKEDGIWRIMSDADSSENGTISETDFTKGTILKF